MTAHLTYEQPSTGDYSIQVTGSKSESNRLLILQALFPKLDIDNLSNSDDSKVLEKALHQGNGIIDIHHAGTAMRFLTAYFAVKPGAEVVLTGSERMQERPIGILVDALRSLGATIVYEKNEGFPPLRIVGQKISAKEVTIKANVSSQYISALMLIAGSLPNGLVIRLDGKVTSVPYINMTLSLLRQIRIKGEFKDNTIIVYHANELKQANVVVESDWSSASYFYSLVALSSGLSIKLQSYKKESLQGDSALVRIYESLGVETVFHDTEAAVTLTKNSQAIKHIVEFDLVNTPDIAQTIAVTCYGLGVGCRLTGLHTLKIKETDRLVALKNELEKLGTSVDITMDSLELSVTGSIRSNIAIETYNDHRMAMAFAPLALKVPIIIMDSGVVSKSFPTFWEDMEQSGMTVEVKN